MNLEDWKIEELAKEGFVLASLRTLSEAEAQSLRSGLLKLLELAPPTSDYDLFGAIQKKAIALDQIRVRKEFSLEHICRELGVPEPKTVAIWYALHADFEEVQQIAAAELERHFNDLWLPSSNDLVIIESSAKWFLYIDHSGFASAKTARSKTDH